MCRRGGFSDGRTPHCLDRRRVFFGAACTPRPISRAARRGSRKRLVATASRCERACKRTGEPSGAFCGKGGARERGDGGFIAADASAKSKKDVGAKRTLLRRGGASGDTAFFKKHSNINGFRTPEQRNYLYSALLKQSISAAIARFIFR